MVVAIVKYAEVLLCETIEQPYYVMKSKMAAPGKFKRKRGDNQILFSPTQKSYFHVFQRNLKLGCIFNNLTLLFSRVEVSFKNIQKVSENHV